MKKVTYHRSKQRRRHFNRKETTTITRGDSKGLSTVVNLSGNALNEEEIHLLSRGLSFCPTPRHINEKQLLDNLESYFRRLHLKEFFMEEEEEVRNDVDISFHPPSTWMPPKGREASLETYIKKIRTGVEHNLNSSQVKRHKDNLLSKERIPLNNLRQRTDIIIKPTDKGSAVVVLSKEDYIKEANRQLIDQTYY